MLREEGNIPPVVADEPPYQELIEGYCRFLRRDRGLAETTVASYRRCLRDFLVSRGDAVSPDELAALSADDLLAFGRQRGAGLGRTAWNHLATALSGFYRWLDLCGHGGAQLVGAVPLRRRYRLADVAGAENLVRPGHGHFDHRNTIADAIPSLSPEATVIYAEHCAMMNHCAVSTDLARSDQRARVAAAAADEQRGQRRRNPKVSVSSASG